MLFLKILACQTPQKLYSLSIILKNLFYEFCHLVTFLHLFSLTDILIDQLGVFVQTSSKCDPFLRLKFLNSCSILTIEYPVAKFYIYSFLDRSILSEFRHFHSKLFDILLNTFVLFFYLFPFNLPIFNTTIDLLDLISIQFLRRWFYLLKLFVCFCCLMIKSL